MGIGRATALAFARAGTTVVICGRNQERGQAVVEQIKATKGKVLFIKTDVAKAAEVNALVTMLQIWSQGRTSRAAILANPSIN